MGLAAVLLLLECLVLVDPPVAHDRPSYRRADAGVNVMLLEAYDDVVFERYANREGLMVVSASHLPFDLLTGHGRSPSEGEELLLWMKDNVDAWRS